MQNILFNKFLKDCLIFFLICLFSTGIIIWILQAVNFLDIVIEDGKDYAIYLKYSFFNFPKIINRLLPFIFFFSFFYIVTKYEESNELMIFWNFGIDKLALIIFFFRFSFFLVLIQIMLSAYVVPNSQNMARELIKVSKTNIYENFIKPKKFIDSIKNLTIFFEDRDINNNLVNIYLKKETSQDNFQITHAKKGRFIDKNDMSTLILFDGETIAYREKKFSSFKFDQSEFNLNQSETNTTTYIKTQEMSTLKLIHCILRLQKIDIKFYQYKKFIENCNDKNFRNILKEITKRVFLPFYIPLLMIIVLLLTLRSKENINYFNYKLAIFLAGLFIIIVSEVSITLLNRKIFANFLIMLMPLVLIVVCYFFLNFKLKAEKK